LLSSWFNSSQPLNVGVEIKDELFQGNEGIRLFFITIMEMVTFSGLIVVADDTYVTSSAVQAVFQAVGPFGCLRGSCQTTASTIRPSA